MKQEVIEVFKHKNFGNIRVHYINGKAWFISADVGRALGYKKPNDAIRVHVKDINKQTTAIYSNKKLTLINEQGLYDLTMNSKMPKAIAFRDWLTEQVLPTLRKNPMPTKAVPVPATPPTMATPVEILEQQLMALKHVDNKVDNLEGKVNTHVSSLELKIKQIEEDSPLLYVECDEIKKWINRIVVKFLGGKGSIAYMDKSIRSKVYADLHGQLRREFDTGTYKAIQRKHYKSAIDFIRGYTPPKIMAEVIQEVNKGMYI